MTIEIPQPLETALQQRANARCLTPSAYVREVLQRDLEATAATPLRPLHDSYGLLAKYGPAPSADEIDENRADSVRHSIFALDAE